MRYREGQFGENRYTRVKRERERERERDREREVEVEVEREERREVERVVLDRWRERESRGRDRV